jgi:AcrR family transcriptional regulator
MAATRISRGDSKAQTRADLLGAARRVFVERGFHAATLDDIAEAAGYTKGAVYSNFRGKDDLFLALLEDHYERRVETYRELMLELDLDDPEETRRAIARIMIEAYQRDPAWWTLVSDFSLHAARDPGTRARLRELRERFLAAMAEQIEVIGERHAMAYRLSPQEIARGTGALMRGLVLDWILDPSGENRADDFEESVAAFLRGAAVPLDERSTT